MNFEEKEQIKETKNDKKSFPNWAKYLTIGSSAALVSISASCAIIIPVMQTYYKNKNGKDAELPKFTVTFLNNKGTVLHTEQVQLGSTPSYNVVPTIEQPENYVNYTFDKWKDDNGNDTSIAILKDTTFRATYKEDYELCTIRYMEADGVTLHQEISNVQKRKWPNYPQPDVLPTKDETSGEEGEQFICCGWEYENPHGDIVVAKPKFDKTINNIKYKLVTNEVGTHVAVAGYTNQYKKDIEILPSWGGYPVTEISENAFAVENANISTSKITSITLPNTITKIGDGAFKGQTDLKTVSTKIVSNETSTNKLPNSIEYLGASAFENCSSLGNISLPENDKIQIIKESCFSNTGITNVVIPNNYTTIENKAFSNCKNLESIKLGTNVSSQTSFGCVENCPKLNNIEVDPNNKNFSSDSQQIGMIFNTDKTILIRAVPSITGKVIIPSSVKEIGAYAFQNCKATSLEFESGDTQLTKINEYTFQNSSFENIDLSSTKVSLIPVGCFKGSSIKTFKFSEPTTEVKANAFEDCQQLEEIYINKNLYWDSIDAKAFVNCKKLAKIIVDTHPNLLSDENGILYKKLEDGSICLICCPPGSKSTTPTLKEPFTSIGDYAYNGCTMDEVFTIPDSVKKIGGFVFNETTGLKTVKLGKSVEIAQINSSCLRGSNIEKFEVVDGNNQMFAENGILYSKVEIPPDTTQPDKKYKMLLRCPPKYNFNSEITIPNGITGLSQFAFKDTAIPSFKLTENIKYIGDLAFNNTTKLKYFEIEDKISSELYIADSAFEKAGDDATGLNCLIINKLYQEPSDTTLTKDVIDKFYEAWGKKGVIVQIDDTTETTIREGAFKNMNQIIGISFSKESKITTFEKRAFFNCKQLVNINLPAKLTTISDGDASDSGVFEYCLKLSDISIPASCSRIGKRAFHHCSSLSNIAFAEKTEHAANLTIGEVAFERTGLTTLDLTNTNVTALENGAFANSDIETLKLGNLTSVPGNCFNNNPIKTILLTKTLTKGSVSNGSFDDVKTIEKVEYDGSKNDWEKQNPLSDGNPFKLSNITKVYCLTDKQWVLL